MKPTIEIDLQPFRTPNFVLPVAKPAKREDGFKESVSYALSELNEAVLSKMCDDFRTEIFRKAGKNFPVDRQN